MNDGINTFVGVLKFSLQKQMNYLNTSYTL
jgi:hypothetical protein